MVFRFRGMFYFFCSSGRKIALYRRISDRFLMSNISLNGAFLVFVFIASLRLGLVFVRKGWEKNGYLSIAIGVLIWFWWFGVCVYGGVARFDWQLGLQHNFSFFSHCFFWGGGYSFVFSCLVEWVGLGVSISFWGRGSGVFFFFSFFVDLGPRKTERNLVKEGFAVTSHVL